MTMKDIEINLQQAFDDQVGKGGLLLSLKLDVPRKEIMLSGNRAGLLLLALHCVRLAISDVPGAHVHFDKGSNLTHADADIVIQRSE